MQVTCPNCGARYAVDPLAIGPAGRTVQCARCSHRWFEKVEAAPAAAPPPPRRPTSGAGFRDPPAAPSAPACRRSPPPRRRRQWGRWSAAAGRAGARGAAPLPSPAATRSAAVLVRMARAAEPRRHARPSAAPPGKATRSAPPAQARASRSTSPPARSNSSTAATSCAASS